MISVADRARNINKCVAVFLCALFHRLVCHFNDSSVKGELEALRLACGNILFAFKIVFKESDNKQLNIGIKSINILNHNVPVLEEMLQTVGKSLRKNTDKLGHSVCHIGKVNELIKLFGGKSVLRKKVSGGFDKLTAFALFFQNIGYNPCEHCSEIVAADFKGDKSCFGNCTAIFGDSRFHNLGIVCVVKKVFVALIIVLKHIADLDCSESGTSHRYVINSEIIGNISTVGIVNSFELRVNIHKVVMSACNAVAEQNIGSVVIVFFSFCGKTGDKAAGQNKG